MNLRLRRIRRRGRKEAGEVFIFVGSKGWDGIELCVQRQICKSASR